MPSNAPIGVFDSGVGGLTVAREIMRQIPNETIVYFGDTARVPYGSKSKETVITYSRQIVKFLQTKEIKAVVIACNTASAFALETISKEIDIPIIGVVKPGAKIAAQTTKNGNIGIIGTEGTINSGIYNEFLSKTNPNVKVFGKACPLFVPLVEEGLLEDPITYEMAGRYLDELLHYDIDTLVLGCTHYPLIRHTIQKVVGDKITLVNPAYETAKSLKDVLMTNKIESTRERPEHRFFVSDGAEKFKAFANTILPCEVLETKDINIEQY
ncbi:glutamate racemase [Mobilisporobacter senegalensis]|uniref:Glutamate racemase n=1 Tax=Mobilisporobacter senegalensis TaxID=1329262 RepID=A0A3N1XL18_9FIRM|nr:glutamate racemase [Mobilisporobacter senegalensis]ROR25752.1 glutamate racemase [Mobilisporobacter senegalensis]